MVVTPKLSPAIYIDTTQALKTLVTQLAKEKQIAVDTESNNMYAYHGQVCLIQLSTRSQDYIIDPLTIDNMQALGDVFYDKSIEKIFHAAEYDLICMQRDFDFEVRNLFDTMFAARLCGAKKFGLGDLLSKHFTIEVDKSHQLDDWGRRPLPKDSLVYAQMDTHYLHRLRDIIYGDLQRLGRLEEANEVFEDVLRIEVKPREFDPNGYWKLGMPRRLNRRQMTFLRELYLMREEIAQLEDKPPFKVLNNKALVHIAIDQPQRRKDLNKVRGVSRRVLRHYSDDILEALDKARHSQNPTPPPRDSIDPILTERYIALHAWRKDCANDRGLDSSLILAKGTLWDLAREMPKTQAELKQIDGIGKWRLEKYGSDLLNVIAKLR